MAFEYGTFPATAPPPRHLVDVEDPGAMTHAEEDRRVVWCIILSFVVLVLGLVVLSTAAEIAAVFTPASFSNATI